MVIQLGFAFTIFFITLGPIKTIPAFAMITRDLDAAARRSLAIRATVIASVIVAVTALIFLWMMRKWRVSAEAMEIAGGILLFLSASQVISTALAAAPVAGGPPPTQQPLDAEAKARALLPIAVPTIVTPIGMVAILVFTDAAQSDFASLGAVYLLLALIMVLNLLGMLFARSIMRLIGVPLFRVAGWLLAVLQAGLAVQTVLTALRVLRIVPA